MKWQKGLAMRKLILLLLALIVLGSGLWFGAAGLRTKALALWLEDRANAGWQAQTQDIATSGFPVHFKTALTDLQLADPKGGLAVSTEKLQINSPSIRPTRFEIVLPTPVFLATPTQKIELSEKAVDALLHLKPSSDLELRTAQLSLNALTAASTDGWQATVSTGQLLMEKIAESAPDYTLLFSADTITLPHLTGSGVFADTIEEMALDAQVTFDRPWDISALEGPRPQPRAIALNDIKMIWGDLELRIAGDLTVDGAGLPTGEVSVKAVNWREMLGIAIETGVVPREFQDMLLRAGEMMAAMSGRADTIDAELTFGNGFVSLGFIPLGPAPRLIIR